MDKNIIKQHLAKTFLSEASKSEVNGTPAIKLAGKIGKENKKVNKVGVDAIGKDMKAYEKPLTKPDANEKTMAQNKFNYSDDKEKQYHDEMEIMNGQEMIQYDRSDDKFKERALEAIEGSSKMGNNPEWANVVAKGQGGDPEFGKNLAKKIKSSIKQRDKQTPTSKMFGDDWEVTKEEGHKPYAFEGKNGKSTIKEEVEWPGSDGLSSDELTNLGRKAAAINNHALADYYAEEADKKRKAEKAMVGLDNPEDMSRQVQYGVNPYNENTNKNKKQIKESMKRLKFKKDFNGVGNALKLIPESYKVDNKVFEMTDGNESYRVRWEGTLTEGKAVILMAADKKMVNEDIQKMKHLMGYKSEDTLGSVKGKARIDENKAFSDVWAKTKKIMEGEDIDGQDAEKEAPFEDADINQAPEAKKHIQGSTSTDKGTQAPAPKTGEWEKADVSHAPEAKKHVQGSVSTDKGTQAPKSKTGEWEKTNKGAAPEATKAVKKK